jgi:hypothetical protein
MFIWAITLVGSFIAGLWLGVFLLALSYPVSGYGDVLSATSTLFAAGATLLGIWFGLEKYKKDQLFKLGIQSSFAEELFKKQREFYEAYLNKVGEIESWIWINGDPVRKNKDDFVALIRELVLLRKSHEKWLSKKQLEKINKIENKHLKMNADSGLAIAFENESTETMKEKRARALDRLFAAVSELLGEDSGYEKYRDELKEVFLVNDIVRMQEYVISKNGEIPRA